MRTWALVGAIGLAFVLGGFPIGIAGVVSPCTTSPGYASLTGTPTCAEMLVVAVLGFGFFSVGIGLLLVAWKRSQSPVPIRAPSKPTRR